MGQHPLDGNNNSDQKNNDNMWAQNNQNVNMMGNPIQNEQNQMQNNNDVTGIGF